MKRCKFVLKNRFQKKIFLILLSLYDISFLERELNINFYEIYVCNSLKDKMIEDDYE